MLSASREQIIIKMELEMRFLYENYEKSNPEISTIPLEPKNMAIFFLRDPRYGSEFVPTRRIHNGRNIPHRNGHLLEKKKFG